MNEIRLFLSPNSWEEHVSNSTVRLLLPIVFYVAFEYMSLFLFYNLKKFLDEIWFFINTFA